MAHVLGSGTVILGGITSECWHRDVTVLTAFEGLSGMARMLSTRIQLGSTRRERCYGRCPAIGAKRRSPYPDKSPGNEDGHDMATTTRVRPRAIAPSSRESLSM